MRLVEADVAYTFDDFVLEPGRSLIESRKHPDITAPVIDFPLKSPIFSAPMDTVTELEMALAMDEVEAGSVIHRYMTVAKQVEIAEKVLHGHMISNVFFAVGSVNDADERVPALYASGVRLFCVDVANGHNIHCWRTVEMIRANYPDVKIMAGNVCTYEGAKQLVKSGATLLRVGVGSGAVCTTRLVTGHGCPQLSAIESCALAKSDGKDIAIVADGGIRHSGDIVKALAAGADMVMVGSLLAGTTQTPGQIIEEDGRLFKYYQGMASEKSRANFFEKSKAGLPVEGISTKVPYMGKSAVKIIEGLCKSIRVGLAYTGASNIQELRRLARWRRVTNAGYIEGTPHGKR